MKRALIFAILAFVLGWWLGRRAERKYLKSQEVSHV